MTVTATPAAAPTATSAPSTSAPSTSAPSTSSAPVKPMSTKDFRSQILGRKTPVTYNEPDPEPVSQPDETADFSDTDVGADVNDPLADQVDETEAPDYSWAQPLADFRDGIHGVATAELLQALAQGQIPEALFDKLSLTMRDGDEEWTGTVEDLRNSAQMHANYTRKAQALAQERKQYEAERTELVEHLHSWRLDADKGLMGLEKMLGEEGVYNIAAKLAERLKRKEDLEAAEAAGHIPPGTAQIVLERERLARENEELKRNHQREEAQQSAAQQSAQAKQIGDRIWAEGQRQFANLGIKPDANGKMPSGLVKLFKQELAILWEAEPGPQPTAQMIRTAAIAAKQRSEEIVREIERSRKPAPAAKPVVTGAAPAGAPAAPNRSVSTGGLQQRNKPMSVKEFKAKIGMR